MKDKVFVMRFDRETWQKLGALAKGQQRSRANTVRWLVSQAATNGQAAQAQTGG